MATKSEIAWAAGLFEGEGCISMMHKGPYYYATAHLCSTDKDVVQRFFKIMSVGRVVPDHQRERHHKRQWRWLVTSRDDFNYAMNLLEPWLGKRRTERLKEVRRLRSKVIYSRV